MAKRKTKKKRTTKSNASSKTVKKLAKSKLFLPFVFTLIIIFIACYFLIDDFKIKIDGFVNSLITDSNNKTNEVKGENDLRIHYLDVGQGDCILLELPDGTNMLIDSGDKSNERANYIINYINDLDIEVIDYLMATHSDQDHIGNMLKIIEAFEIENAYIPYIENTEITQTYNNFYNALLAEDGCNIIYNEIFRLIKSTSVENSFFIAFLSPSERDTVGGEYDKLNSSATAENKNAVSPIILLEYMGKKAIFTGDVVGKSEQKVIDNYNNNVYDVFEETDNISINIENVDILKIAHHGSSTYNSNSSAFLELLAPKYAVISVGENSYGHPTSEVLDRLNSISTIVFRTDVKGTVVATIFPDTDKNITFEFIKDGIKTQYVVSACDKIVIVLIKKQNYIETSQMQ